MTQPTWKDLVLPSGEKDLLYELFHENSKLGRHTQSPSNEDVLDQMKHLHASLTYEGYPRIDLPRSITPSNVPLFQVMQARTSLRSFKCSTIPLLNMATILYHGYGVTRTRDETHLPRGFRVVPSAGGLYPLEIYVHSACVEDHQPGLFHYNPEHHCLHRLRAGDATGEISNMMIQSEIGLKATVLIFITAIFERSTFKYQDRGYRFALIEAGHVAQNVNLAACALNYSSVNIGGFFDREVDNFLELDGLTHSTLYMIAIGDGPMSAQNPSVSC